MPFDDKEWDCAQFRHPGATKAMVDNNLVHIWGKQKLNIWKPRFQPVTGNKTMKPLYLMFQPEYKGAEIFPYQYTNTIQISIQD